jgi:putative membrane protein
MEARRIAVIVWMVVVPALAPSFVAAQGVPGTRKSPAGWPAVAEVANQNALLYSREVIARIREMNEIELRTGQMAQVRAGTSEVRRYGRLLVADHASADRRLVDYAARKLGMQRGPREEMPPVDRDLMAEHVAETERLATLSGAEFDNAFLRMMVSDHQSAVSLLEIARETVDDPDLRMIFRKVLPILRQDLWIAQTLLGDAG